MRVLKNKWASLLAITITAAALTGCGGGGSSGSTATNTGLNITEFLGTWKFNNNASGNPAGCTPLGYGTSYGSLYRPSVYSATSFTDTVEVYSDMSCSNYLGLLAINYSITWSAASLAGKSNVAKALSTITGFVISRDGAPGYTLSTPPSIGHVYKELLDVEGTLMYNSDYSAPLDADGYPTAVKSTAWYTR